MPVYTPIRACQAQATAAEATVYTSTGVKTIIKEVIINNTAGSPVTFGLSLVPTGNAAGLANRIFGDTVLAPGQVSVVDLAQVMNTGDFLSMKASAATSVTVTVSGVTVQ